WPDRISFEEPSFGLRGGGLTQLPERPHPAFAETTLPVRLKSSATTDALYQVSKRVTHRLPPSSPETAVTTRVASNETWYYMPRPEVTKYSKMRY
ncbi:MAG: hypothetical protein ACREYF_00375, partial [Gammaproteobacteria bacterium]